LPEVEELETTTLELLPPKQPISDSERNTIIKFLTNTYKPIIDCQSIYRNDMLNEYYNLVPFL
jgi:hypothetical protein